MQRTMLAAGLTAALVLGGAGVAAAAPVDIYFATCAEAQLAGAVNIGSDEPGYRPALDRDGDGIACEQDEGDAGSGSGAAGSGSGSASGGTSAAGSGSAGGEQVSVVPQGGAQTGDGSTEPSGPSVLASLAWWAGAGLLGAGAVVALRRRPAARAGGR